MVAACQRSGAHAKSIKNNAFLSFFKKYVLQALEFCGPSFQSLANASFHLLIFVAKCLWVSWGALGAAWDSLGALWERLGTPLGCLGSPKGHHDDGCIMRMDAS